MNLQEEEKKAREVIKNLKAIKSLKTETIKVSIIDNKNDEIWSYGFENGIPCGVSNKSLNFKKIVEIIEIALEQAKGDLFLS